MVCVATTLEQFSIEFRKLSGIGFVLLYCIIGLDKETRASFSTNQVQL